MEVPDQTETVPAEEPQPGEEQPEEGGEEASELAQLAAFCERAVHSERAMLVERTRRP